MADKSLQALTSAVYQIAENSPKIQKDVKDIRDAICGTDGILGSLVSIDTTMNKMNRREVLSELKDKKTDNNKRLLKQTDSITGLLKSILKNVERIQEKGSSISKATNQSQKDTREKVRGLESLSKSIEIIERLRNIKLKDFLFAKTKMKHISKLMTRFTKMFRRFKNTKEMEDTVAFANSSIDLVKKLSKIAILSIPAKIGAKTIEKIFLGGKKNGGLLKVFRRISKDELSIKRGRFAMKDMERGCGSMFLTTIILTGIGVVSIPAMIGALLMKGVIWLLVGSFKLLSKSATQVIKGSLVLLIMSASVITFALGLGLMAKAVKNINWKDFGMMMASIGGLGAVMAILGIPVVAGLVALGSVTLLIMGASLGLFALSLMAWQKIDVKTAMGNISLAVEGLREAFGLELGKKAEGDNRTGLQRLGGGLLDVAMAVLNFGKSFFIMGQLLLAGAALGMLYHGLKNWAKFTDGKKAAKNIKEAVGALKEVFGLNKVKGDNKAKLKGLGGSILDMGIALFQSGKALIQLGTITLATAMADIIRVTLIPWNKYDPKPAMKNMNEAIVGLKEIFGLQDNNDDFGGKLEGLGGSLLDMGIALFQSGKALIQVGAITIATAMSDLIRAELSPWDDYDPSKAVGHLSYVITNLKTLFGLDDSGGDTSLVGKLGNLGGSLIDMATTFINSGATLLKLGTIILAVGMSNKILDYLKPWESSSNVETAVSNIDMAITKLLDIFGLTPMKKEEESWWDTTWVGQGFNAVGSLVTGIIDGIGGLGDAIGSLGQGAAASAKMGSILAVISIMDPIKTLLTSWISFNVKSATTNISKVVGGIIGVVEYMRELDTSKYWSLGGFSSYFNISTQKIKEGLQNISAGLKDSSILKSAINPLEKTVSAVNALDITKASTMIELFKSFSKITDHNVDRFTAAVHEFGEKCEKFEEALNNFNPEVSVSGGGTGGGDMSGGGTSSGGGINNAALATAIANAIKKTGIPVNITVPDINLYAEGKRGKKLEIRIE